MSELSAENDARWLDLQPQAGRWCATCGQHGSHHTDKHEEFATAGIVIRVTPPTVGQP